MPFLLNRIGNCCSCFICDIAEFLLLLDLLYLELLFGPVLGSVCEAQVHLCVIHNKDSRLLCKEHRKFRPYSLEQIFSNYLKLVAFLVSAVILITIRSRRELVNSA